MRTTIILLLLLLATAPARDIGVDFRYLGLTETQQLDAQRSQRLLEGALYDRGVNRVTITVKVGPLVEDVLGFTSGSTYTYQDGIFYSWGATININEDYIGGFSREKFSAIILHEMAHVLAWDRALWDWRGILFGDVLVDGQTYVGGASRFYDVPMTVDNSGHLGYEYDYDLLGYFVYLGADAIEVDDLHLMDADYDDNTFIDLGFWGVFEDVGWTVDWDNATTGLTEEALPHAPRRSRRQVIIDWKSGK